MFTEIIIWPLIGAMTAITFLLALKLRTMEKKLLEQGKLLAIVNEDMKALLICEQGMGKRIKTQQQQVRDVIERQDKVEISDGGNTSYKQAMVLLQKGASTDELIDACDLSRGELDLLSRLKIAQISAAS